MAFETFKSALVAPTSGATQTITGIPFQPKAVIFFCACLTSSQGNTDVYLTCFGVAGGTALGDNWVIPNAENGTTASNAGRLGQTQACIILPLNGNPAKDAQANLSAFTSDGFTLSWSDFPATANMQVHYLALGGADLTNVKAAQHIIQRTTIGTEATTGVGFMPDCVLFASPGVPGSLVDSTFDFGAARRTPTTQRFAHTFFENDGANTMDTFQRRSITKCLVMADATSVIEAEADISSFDAGGFTMNWTDPVPVTNSRVFYYLALKGGQYDLGVDSTPTVTGNRSVVNGFQPTGVFFSWSNRTMAVNVSTTAAGDAGYGVGALDSALNQGYTAVNQTDADANSQSWRTHGTVTSVVNLLKGVRAAKASRAGAGVTSLDANGFTLNWNPVDAAAYQYHYIAFGSNAAGAAVNPPKPTLAMQAVSRAANW